MAFGVFESKDIDLRMRDEAKRREVEGRVMSQSALRWKQVCVWFADLE